MRRDVAGGRSLHGAKKARNKEIATWTAGVLPPGVGDVLGWPYQGQCGGLPSYGSKLVTQAPSGVLRCRSRTDEDQTKNSEQRTVAATT